jgi:hypothetical protein
MVWCGVVSNHCTPLKVAHFVDKIGNEWVFFTVAEAVDACLSFKFANP